jgi:hypothetical protein
LHAKLPIALLQRLQNQEYQQQRLAHAIEFPYFRQQLAVLPHFKLENSLKPEN